MSRHKFDALRTCSATVHENAVRLGLTQHRCRHPMTGTIQPYNCRCTNGTSECNNGQRFATYPYWCWTLFLLTTRGCSCFWFSQGCTVGCPNCDNNGTRLPGWDHCPEVPKSNITRLLPKYRTANQGAEVGTVADVFRFNPWSAPGTAPVLVSLVNSSNAVLHRLIPDTGVDNCTPIVSAGPVWGCRRHSTGVF